MRCFAAIRGAITALRLGFASGGRARGKQQRDASDGNNGNRLHLESPREHVRSLSRFLNNEAGTLPLQRRRPAKTFVRSARSGDGRFAQRYRCNRRSPRDGMGVKEVVATRLFWPLSTLVRSQQEQERTWANRLSRASARRPTMLPARGSLFAVLTKSSHRRSRQTSSRSTAASGLRRPHSLATWRCNCQQTRCQSGSPRIGTELR